MSNDPRFDRALGYLSSGQTDSAIDMLAELLGEAPEEPVYHAVLAACLLNQGRLAGADYELGVAQSLDPNLAYVYFVRSQLLFYQRKFKDALASCDEALRLDPEFVDALLMQARLFLLLDKPDDALNRLERAAFLSPNSVEVLVAFGDYHNAQGSNAEALTFARDAMRIDAGSDDANVLMGETLLALRDIAEADMHARYAVSQNPSNQAALRLLVNVRMRENWFNGLWWRFNNWISRFSTAQQGLVLILGFLLFQLSAQIVTDLGYPTAGSVLGYAWLGIVLYSWVALPIYERALQKTLSEFRFNPKF